MSDEPKGNAHHLLKCPLCEGRGELPDKELFERLSETDLGHKLASYMANVVTADEKAKDTPGKREFQRHVDTWNCTHFLWRRSPKE